jgi:hypothetical protein
MDSLSPYAWNPQKEEAALVGQAIGDSYIDQHMDFTHHSNLDSMVHVARLSTGVR